MVDAQGHRNRSIIMVGVDGSTEAQRALHWAAAEAELRRWPLQILHAAENSQALLAENRGSPQKIVDTAVADIRDTSPAVNVAGRLVAGGPVTALAQSTTERDILVVGSRGLGWATSALVGSVSSAVARHSASPVVVVRDITSSPRDTDSNRGVVLGIDGSEASTTATGFAFEEASLHGLPLTVVHAVWDPYTESQAVVANLTDPERVVVDESARLDVAETIAGWREQFPDVQVATRYESGRPDRVLTDLSDGSDLLIVGTRGRRTAAAALLSSVSCQVLLRAYCPVAVVSYRPRPRSHRAGG